MGYKNSFQILKDIDDQTDISFNKKTNKEYWENFKIGSVWYSTKEKSWLIRTEDGYKKTLRTNEGKVPLFCPNCKKPLISQNNIYVFKNKEMCLDCYNKKTIK